MTLQSEYAVYGQAEQIGPAAGREFLFLFDDIVTEFVHAFAGLGRHREQRRAFEERSFEEFGNVLDGEFEQLGIDHVDFGHGDEAMLDPKQGADFEVLARLRHDAFVRGDDQHHEVDARRARDHILDEFFMAGHVHDAEPSAAGQVAEREAELDGDAPAFFLFEAVAVDPGQLAHERGFTVVDVTRRSHYDSHSNASGGRAAARTRASRRAGGNDFPRTPSVPPHGGPVGVRSFRF